MTRRSISLADFVGLKRGYDLPTRQRGEGSIPILGSFGITGTHDVPKHSGPGVSIGRSGASIGVATYCPDPYWPLNTTLYVNDFKGNNPRFVYYVLDALDFADYNSGSAQPSLNRNYLAAIPIPEFDITEQAIIVAILGSIDDLIENNRRRTEVLEEMAQAIYREWFVHFRYPGHEDATFVDSPLGPIPEVWALKTLSDLCSRIQAGGTPKRSEPAFWNDGTVDWYKTGDLTDSVLISSSERITEQAVATSSARTFEPDTILMAIYGSPTVGRLGLVETACSANQAALGLVAAPAASSTVHLWFALRELREPLNLIAQGAAQQNISKKKVAEAQVLAAPAEMIAQFTEIADAPWRLGHRLARANAALVSIRDVLVPKLVTGEIDVAELDLDALVEATS